VPLAGAIAGAIAGALVPPVAACIIGAVLLPPLPVTALVPPEPIWLAGAFMFAIGLAPLHATSTAALHKPTARTRGEPTMPSR
jgi:hypothetical protein